MSICTICEREYTYNRNKGHRKTICNSCNANRKRNTLKAKAVESLGGECSLCGYSKCIVALTFHHIDPEQKLYDISDMYSMSWSRVETELSKCILLCFNCHMEVHAGVVQWQNVAPIRR